MSSPATTAAGQLNNSTSTQSINTNTELPTHHIPSFDSTSPSNNDNPATPLRAIAFPPRPDDQTLHAYIVANFTLITIIIAVVTLVATVAGIIVAIVLAVIYK
ncbi:hypothetical protein B0T12DRAFT_471972 [Alternaria alternata]|jgi:hypothetical protein|nr:hypothetical protein B0T12DRAFT_471972 [Alternaria alternata]